MPGCDCRLREPDRQAPALAQGRIVFGPVRDPAPLLRDTMTASSIGLERHRGIQGQRRGNPPTPATPARQPPDPCNKLATQHNLPPAHPYFVGLEQLLTILLDL